LKQARIEKWLKRLIILAGVVVGIFAWVRRRREKISDANPNTTGIRDLYEHIAQGIYIVSGSRIPGKGTSKIASAAAKAFPRFSALLKPFVKP
jgi:hypothetical protein